MFRYIVALITLQLAFMLSAQEVTISGQVLDGDSSLPLSFSTVAISRAADTNLVSGTVCDEDGRFEIQGDFEGEYLVGISYMGYE